MRLRQAKKIVRNAHPRRHTKAQALKACRKVWRWSRRSSRCKQCPAADCSASSVCSYDGWADVLLMSIDSGRHPWGDWKCSMQLLAEGVAQLGPPVITWTDFSLRSMQMSPALRYGGTLVGTEPPAAPEPKA